MARPFTHLAPEVMRSGPPPGQARRELLFIHGAWHGPWCWDGLAGPLAADGFGVNRLALPGHGDRAWPLPATTSLNDYADLARRAAAAIDRPVLVGHSLGGWLAMKVLEVADLPAVLIAPLPPRGLPWLRLLRMMAGFPAAVAPCLALRPLRLTSPAMAGRLLWNPALGPAEQARRWQRLVAEPGRVGLEMALGLVPCRPRPGRAPRLVVAAGRDYFLPQSRMRGLARSLGAGLAGIAGAAHAPWPEQAPALQELLRDFLAGLERA
ncbi:MAG: alpha/beta hydrolase [Pseudomonadota bacterium]